MYCKRLGKLQWEVFMDCLGRVGGRGLRCGFAGSVGAEDGYTVRLVNGMKRDVRRRERTSNRRLRGERET